ncbi:MAG: AAA family ATPase [Gemmatimonadetes bacterium]|nr:AAA family ATPase [Gemmatimonadota bacterium]
MDPTDKTDPVSDQLLIDIQLDRDAVPSFEAYPFCLDVVRHLHKLRLNPGVTFFIGENGSGKSTLLEALAVAWGLNAEGGSRHHHFDTRSSHSALHQYLRLSRGVRRARDAYFLRAESFFNVASEIERLDEDNVPAQRIGPAYGPRALHEQSHGESFLSLLMNRFHPGGLFILDEPEAALSPNRQMAAMARIHELVGQSSQFVIATHSPIIMAYPEATIYQLDEDGITQVDYTETEHYTVTKAFLNGHERMLSRLLDQDE